MEQDEKYLVELRDCFTGGYTLAQFCIDEKISKPLFVSEEKFLQFLWEVHVQFHYDKRLTARFGVLDMPTGKIIYSNNSTYLPMVYKNFSEINLDDFDKIIFLTAKDVEVAPEKKISLAALTQNFLRKTYAEIPALKFLQRHPQVKLFLTKYPSVRRYKGGVAFAKKLESINSMRKLIRDNKKRKLQTSLDKFGYSNKDVFYLLGAPKVKTNLDGSTAMADSNYPLLKIENGKRVTAYQPEKFLNRIFFVGTCHDYGVAAPFDKTIASYLQKFLSEKNFPYRVENESQRYARRYQDIFYNLNNMTPAPGDIIFLYVRGFQSKLIPSVDFSDAFDPPHNFKEIFCIKGHFNEIGYKILAEKYFDFLTTNNFFREKNFDYPAPPPICHRYGIPSQFESGEGKIFVNEDLEAYKKILRAKKISIGALVMNCNPFTLGHQYLVEYAASKVAKLYLFVVEEDKSEFPFADRIELVRQGVKNFPNVEVLPSGKFIISQQTFSGYFNKAELQDVAVDSSEDVEIFGREIAPTLGITIRFAGEEPTDNVTRQYNETMKKILPRYGVEFQEIPRKNFGGEPISASKVRAALKVGDFDKIKNLVPPSTYLYLRGRYSMSK